MSQFNVSLQHTLFSMLSFSAKMPQSLYHSAFCFYLLQPSGVPPPQPATVEPTAVPPPPAAYTSWEQTAAADDLRRRQEELERKAADLERREQEMQRNLHLQGINIR